MNIILCFSLFFNLVFVLFFLIRKQRNTENNRPLTKKETDYLIRENSIEWFNKNYIDILSLLNEDFTVQEINILIR